MAASDGLMLLLMVHAHAHAALLCCSLPLLYCCSAATLLLLISDGPAVRACHGQVSLRWVVQHDVMLAVESTSAGHLASDLDIFGWELSAEDMATLDAQVTPSGDYSFKCT